MTEQAMKTLAMSEAEQRESEVLKCMECFRCWLFATAMFMGVESTSFWKGESRRCYQDYMQYQESVREEASVRVKAEKKAIAA